MRKDTFRSTVRRVKAYRLFIKRRGEWVLLCVIPASNHDEAFRTAMTLLSPELHDKPIRLETVENDAPKKTR